MIYKRIIYALLYSGGFFHLSRNFRLQQVGDINWLRDNFGFGETCNYIDELMIILVTKNPNKEEVSKYFADINKLREKIFVPITLGGGIRTLSQAKDCFTNGADKILINYLAHSDIETINNISDIYGSQALSIMVDYKNINGSNYSYMDAAKTKSKSLKDYLNSIKHSKFGELIVNSVERDGAASGLDLSFFDDFPNNLNKPILAMGGAGKPDHFVNVLENNKISGIVTANLFNFLGSGLKLARSHSINNGVRLIKFDTIT